MPTPMLEWLAMSTLTGATVSQTLPCASDPSDDSTADANGGVPAGADSSKKNARADCGVASVTPSGMDGCRAPALNSSTRALALMNGATSVPKMAATLVSV